MNDVIIIGAGPAGLTAALYAARAGLSVLVFEKNIYGGQVAVTNEIENYPAIEHITGADFSLNLYNQVVNQKVEILLEEVKRIDFKCDVKKIFTDSREYASKTVIIANGVKRKTLGCPGELEFFGKGVSYCATCDGAFFKNKDIVVVGGGNTALEDALFLSNICRSVTILIRSDVVKAEKFLLNSVKNKKNIKLVYNTVVTEIGGNSRTVSFANVLDKISGEKSKLYVSAVFVAIGLIPENTIFADFINLDNDGYILSNESCKTNVPGVFVAGDTRKKSLRQIITAASDGAIAAKNVLEYIAEST